MISDNEHSDSLNHDTTGSEQFLGNIERSSA